MNQLAETHVHGSVQDNLGSDIGNQIGKSRDNRR